MKDRPKVETKEKIDMNCYPYTGGGQGVGDWGGKLFGESEDALSNTGKGSWGRRAIIVLSIRPPPGMKVALELGWFCAYPRCDLRRSAPPLLQSTMIRSR